MSQPPSLFGTSPPSSHHGTPPSSHTTGPWNGGVPKYINEFTKALSGEVRILLEEVGKLRDERRALQSEIAELMALKAKHGHGGEYSPHWGPPKELTPPSTFEAPPATIEGSPTSVEARPGWRTVHKEYDAGSRAPSSHMASHVILHATPTSSHAPITPPRALATNLPAWAQWRPDPHHRIPTPQSPPAPIAIPPRDGLFGPSTPPPV